MSPRARFIALALCTLTAAVSLPQAWKALRAQSLGPVQGDGSDCVSLTLPAVIRAGERFAVPILLQNNGTTAWTKGGVRLTAGSALWGIDAADIVQQSVAPGGFASLLLPVTAPATPGTYSFAWQLERDKRPFGAICKQNARVLVPLTQCSDGIDNDGDGVTDFPDEGGCTSPRDNDEKDIPEMFPLSLTETRFGEDTDVLTDQKNVGLARVEAHAGTASGVLLTAISFRAVTGSLLNATNYTLWIDADGNGWGDKILSSEPQVLADHLTFATMTGGGLWLGPSAAMALEVHADIAPAPSRGNLQIALLTDPDGLSAQTFPGDRPLTRIQVNNTCPYEQCTITVQTAPAPLLLIQERAAKGDLFVTKGPGVPFSRQVLAGTGSETLLALQLRAERAAIDILGLRVTATGSVPPAFVEQVTIVRKETSAVVGTATQGACGSGAPVHAFCADLPLLIPEGKTVNLLLKARLRNDEAGTVSGRTFRLMLEKGSVRAADARTGVELARSDGDGTAEREVFIGTDQPAPDQRITSVLHTAVLSKIASIANAGPATDTSGFTPGSRTIGRFIVKAAPHRNAKDDLNVVTLSGMYFRVIATNITLARDGVRLFNAAKPSLSVPCAPSLPGTTLAEGDLTGSFLLSCSLAQGTVPTRLPQGTSATFVLQANVVQTSGTKGSRFFLVSLKSFNDMKTTRAGTHLLWEDTDRGGSRTFEWADTGAVPIQSTEYRW